MGGLKNPSLNKTLTLLVVTYLTNLLSVGGRLVLNPPPHTSFLNRDLKLDDNVHFLIWKQSYFRHHDRIFIRYQIKVEIESFNCHTT